MCVGECFSMCMWLLCVEEKLTGLQVMGWHSAVEHWTRPERHWQLEQGLGLHSSPSLYSRPSHEQDAESGERDGGGRRGGERHGER